MLVDENVPAPKCEFLLGPDVNPFLDVSKAKELCGRNTFFSSEEEANDCVLSYSAATATDDCREVLLTATREVIYSDSPDALTNCTRTVKITVSGFWSSLWCCLVSSAHPILFTIRAGYGTHQRMHRTELQ